MTVWTVGSVLKWAVEDFTKRHFDTPRLEAEVLLGHVLNWERIKLYTNFDRPLNDAELGAYRDAIRRRRDGLPAAYIIGHREFWSLEFAVDERVLVPRPETELLVEAALARYSGGRVLDLCTGSGCVAVAMASEKEDMFVDAVDLSAGACEVASENAARHNVDGRVSVYQGDLFSPLPESQRYSIVTANPPYVTDSEWSELSVDVRSEPRMALTSGHDGLDLIRRIIAEVDTVLEDRASLLIELDPRQVARVVELGLQRSSVFQSSSVIEDLSGKQRVVVLER